MSSPSRTAPDTPPDTGRERGKPYDPQSTEQPLYQQWERSGVGAAAPDSGPSKNPFVILMPPPNVTGVLHVGHVLNNTIQDVLIRWQRMQGRDALWIPGIDHAGIATQHVVERELKKQGRDRRDMSREEFVGEVWKWKEQSGGTILQQLRRLGCLPDWPRLNFTLDEHFVRAVLHVFVQLYNDGLIYRGNYLVNWCPKDLTAISDEEVEHRDVTGKLHYLRYPMPDTGSYVVVATTRPETMLGDVAVAVNPKDPRYAALHGARIVLPLVNREMRLIPDDMVDREFGTGAVKITPAHDPNDFQLAARHDLPAIEALDAEGRVSLDGPYKGMDRLEARKAILRDLEAAGLVEKIEDYRTSIGHHDRCGTMIEPRLSLQWFVKMQPLAEPALAAYKNGEVRFHPERWGKIYEHWMTNIRDWCISRQLWWGHRIPVYTCDACSTVVASVDAPATCGTCGGAAFTQDPDVLDTWFSSWLWPFATLGWPDAERERALRLDRYFPSHVLVTAPEILFFWVARMIMASLRFTGEVPFADVYLHGIVRDGKGRKMSKSLGNSPDPIDLIDRSGADALRFTMMTLTPQGSDVLFDESKMDIGKHFANKVWNAARLVNASLEGWTPPATAPSEGDGDLPARWIRARFAEAVRDVNAELGRFEMLDATRTLHEFIWRDFCDWYLELAKPRVAAGADQATRAATQHTLWSMLRGSLILLHPFMPFVTDEIWRSIPHAPGDPESIVTAQWPSPARPADADRAVAAMTELQDVVRVVREIRAEMRVAPGQGVPVVLRGAGARALDARDVQLLARASSVTVAEDGAAPRHAASGVAGAIEVFVPLEGLLDLDVERKRLEKEVARVGKEVEFARGKLTNADFLAKAKPEVIAQQREKLAAVEATLAKLEGYLAAVSS